MLAGAPLLAALGIACLLGLRHASDPDHLVAVTVAGRGRPRRLRRRPARRVVGPWARVTLLAVGLPLVLLESQLPAWLEGGAEKAVGVVIVVLAVRVLVRRLPGVSHRGNQVRSGRQALGIGVLHGVAGSGAIVVLLMAQLPSESEAAFALLAFAPMSMLSMVLCTSGFAWAFTRPAVAPIYNSLLVPALGVFSLMFGGWYAGIL